MAQPLKDMVDRTVVLELADRFAEVVPQFDRMAFTSEIMEELPVLELKPRIEAIARKIAAGLPVEYRSALEAVVAVSRNEPPVAGFAAWPLCTFVEIFGVEDPEASLAAMEHLTQRASCEFAIRPFLEHHFDAAYATLQRFAEHPEETVRRLPSEGMRPRLPWGRRVQRLIDDPVPGLELLERLRHDPSESVRRSVANHLNDVAKDHPETVIDTVRRWQHEEPAVDGALLRHALRTLIKRGDSRALAVLGYTSDPAVRVVEFSVSPPVVRLGERIELHAELHSTAEVPQRLVVDFVIHHVTSRGDTSPKVFKWTTVELPAAVRVELTKRRLIQHASTRTYFPGLHRVDLQVAGQILATASFQLETAS